MKYYTWEEYAPNKFRRWDTEAGVWVAMDIHTCCLMHSKRTLSQGRTFKEAKLGLKSAINFIKSHHPQQLKERRENES